MKYMSLTLLLATTIFIKAVWVSKSGEQLHLDILLKNNN
jgi:hypothetical protein